MIYVLWHGRPSYSLPTIEDKHLESFKSIRDARSALVERSELAGSLLVTFNFVDKDPGKVLLPAVTTDSTMDVYTYDPRELGDAWPTFRLVFGPRGGVRREDY